MSLRRVPPIRLRLFCLTALALAACDPGSPDGVDAGELPDRMLCSAAADCDDGLFCNGVERCEPDASGADARGCTPAEASPCSDGERCDESLGQCAAIGCEEPDADGDGHDRPDCGGDDCDDGDANRYPGNLEVCDANDRDEDCDLRTYGIRDADGDGAPDSLCCNGQGVDRVCGDDCDDARAGAGPSAGEVCDGIDNDCDELVDEDALNTYTIDVDGDGWGSAMPDAATEQACFRPDGYAEVARDCDDGNSSVHPAATELCALPAIDENCDGATNPPELCTCEGTESRLCEANGVCAFGTEMCSSGAWGACSIAPGVEICDEGDDEDCDGNVDEGLTLDCYADADNDGYAASGATSAQRCPVAGRESVGGCPTFTTNRAPLGQDLDCNDDNSAVHPAAQEICVDGLTNDDDCDGSVDEGVAAACYTDVDNDTYAPAGSPETSRCRDTGRPAVGFCPANWTNRAPVVDAMDCNDGAFGVNPAADEVCDGAMVDENCDGSQNEGCSCTGTMTRSCAEGGLLGDCASGTQMCMSGGWSACSIAPGSEVCNMDDDDCDGATDEGTTITCWADPDQDDYAASGASPTLACGACPSMTTARAPMGEEVDCAPMDAAINPGETEICDGIDNDCSSGGGDVQAEDRDGDGHTNPSYGGCVGGYPKDDCHDNDADVYPGQTEFFGSQYCPSSSRNPGTCGCSASECYVGGTPFCSGGTCQPASWDYDCDMVDEREPPSSGCSGSCGSSACPSIVGPVPYSAGTQCGNLVANRSCGCASGFSCSWTTLSGRPPPLGCH